MLVGLPLEEQTHDLVENLVPEVFLDHKDVYLGLAILVVLAAVEGMVDLSESVLRKDLRKAL